MENVLVNEPVVEFNEAQPIKREEVVSRKEILRRKARGGIDPGARRKVSTVGGRSFVEESGLPPIPRDGGIFGQDVLPPPPTTIDPLLVPPTTSVPAGPPPVPVETVPGASLPPPLPQPAVDEPVPVG